VRAAMGKFRLALRSRPDFDRGAYNLGTVFYTFALALQSEPGQPKGGSVCGGGEGEQRGGRGGGGGMVVSVLQQACKACSHAHHGQGGTHPLFTVFCCVCFTLFKCIHSVNPQVHRDEGGCLRPLFCATPDVCLLPAAAAAAAAQMRPRGS
jgi:hypothetical protein